ncbi:MAG TPA: hypothetical protein VGH45_06310 [Solirubrobacteraceae bacterium]
MKELIEAKARGEDPELPEPAESGEGLDLAAALEASLNGGPKQSTSSPKKSAKSRKQSPSSRKQAGSSRKQAGSSGKKAASSGKKARS